MSYSAKIELNQFHRFLYWSSWRFMCKRSAGPTLTRRCWGSYKLNPRPSSRIAARRRQRGHRRQADDQGGHQLNLRSFLPLACSPKQMPKMNVECQAMDAVVLTYATCALC
ncbi:hypothetical protein ZWY2020_046784 [Hordeum vulgare]|nr:hypothetical protein ZWY2020_046784 [Hordeum vulgare]